MILLHAVWIPTWNEDPEPGFFLWGEDQRWVPAVAAGGDRRGAAPERQRMADQASPREVRSHLSRVADGILYECAEPQAIEILWPTLAGRPLPTRDSSPERLRRARLRPWRVRGLLVPPADALRFLTELPHEAPDPLSYGGSIRLWTEAAGLCLGLMARQRMIPSVVSGGVGATREHRAVWRVALTEEEDRQALRLLAQALPALCGRGLGALAAAAPAPQPTDPVGGEDVAEGEELIQDFLDGVLDASVRQLLAEDGFPDVGGRKGGEGRFIGGPLGAWMRGLGWIDGQIEGEIRTLEGFAREVRAWNDVLVAQPRGSFQTVFQLVPPPEPEEEPGGLSSSGVEDEPWTLEFFLQSRNDPQCIVPAAQVWEESALDLHWGGRTFEHPHVRLLEDLGRASRIFRPIEKTLEGAVPTSCALTLEEAYTFLSQAGPLLEESGLGVRVPSWWQAEESRPRFRLHLRPHTEGPGPGGADGSSAGLGGQALVDYDWKIALGEQFLDAEEFHRLAKQKNPLVRMKGRWFELRPEEAEWVDRLLREERGSNGLTISEAVRLGLGGPTSRPDYPPPQVEAEGWIGDLLAHLREGSSPEPILMGPAFHGTLRPYQERGVGWLEFLRRFGLGACLADDMGLGKTIQLIGLLLHERRDGQAGRPGPTLVLCPMSVVGNWQREIQRFGPSLRVMVHHGVRRLKDDSFLVEAAAHDVVISTYALAHRDRHRLRRVPWERLTLDEAQNIKNPAALQTRAVRSLKARTRVALTGTPLENRLSELWSILDFLNPGYLGNRAEFGRTYAVPIERYRDPKRRAALQNLIQPFLLRRLKTDPNVLRDLPEKLEMQVYCNLTREQATLYQAVVNEMMSIIGTNSGIGRRGLILAALTRLKQVCNHPVHFLQDGSTVEGRSGKVERLTEMMEEVLSVGDRALVFTQFTEMGWILQSYLAERFRQEVLFLHGGTPKAARDRMIDRFQAGDAASIFILSLRAGGTGLNLTAANHVFHFDRWWNPAVEDQATDRVFRIGQTRRVQVHKFVCVGTLEERIDRMIREKRELASMVVSDGEQWLTELDTEQLREVLALSRDAVSED